MAATLDSPNPVTAAAPSTKNAVLAAQTATEPVVSLPASILTCEPSSDPFSAAKKDSKNAERMRRKAESARVARLRKKEYISTLEAQIAAAKAEVDRLRAGKPEKSAADILTPTAEHSTPMDKEGSDTTVSSHLSSVAPANTISECLKQHCSRQQEMVDAHMECISDALASDGYAMQVAFAPPTDDFLPFPSGLEGVGLEGLGPALDADGIALEAPFPPLELPAPEELGPEPKRQRTESMGLGTENGLAPKSGREEVWDSLSAELCLTEGQQQELESHRKQLQASNILLDCEVLLKELQQRICEQLNTTRCVGETLGRVLTEEQANKCVAWMEAHPDVDISQLPWGPTVDSPESLEASQILSAVPQPEEAVSKERGRSLLGQPLGQPLSEERGTINLLDFLEQGQLAEEEEEEEEMQETLRSLAAEMETGAELHMVEEFFNEQQLSDLPHSSAMATTTVVC